MKKKKLFSPDYLLMVKMKKSSAITSFVLGIIAFLLSWTGLLAFVLSVIAISKAKRAKGIRSQPHRVFRIIGLILGILALISSIVIVIATPFIIAALVAGGVTIVGVGAIGGIAWAIVSYGPMLLDTLYNFLNETLVANFGLDISSIEQIIQQLKEYIQSLSEMMSSVSGETTSLLLL